MRSRIQITLQVSVFLILISASVVAQINNSGAVYLDSSQPIDVRVDDLIHRMTLEQKASQLVNQARAIPELQVPAYDWWSEALHGVANAGTATVFPEPIGLAATFDDPLIHQMAIVIGTEARAKHNQAVKAGRRDIMEGLDYTGVQTGRYTSPLRRKEAIDLSPEDGARYNLREGEKVRVSSRRGSVVAPVRFDPGLRPGLAFLTMHFHDQVSTNDLTIDAVHLKSGTAEFKATAIRIEKYQGA